MSADIPGMVRDIQQKVAASGGLRNVYFIGCGGSLAAIYPGKYLLASKARTFGAAMFTSNEFVHAPPDALDSRCLCVVCSLKATPETVEAVQVANRRGALTIAMTGSPDTPMAKAGQYAVVYSSGDAQVYSEANQAMVLRIAFELLRQIEGYGDYQAAMDSFGRIDGLVESAKIAINPLALEFARSYRDEPLFYVLASGPVFNAAYTMASCHFMEMQWKHAVVVHTGEYFHGPFETTDDDTPFILLMSEGRTRPLDERCLAFLKQHAKKVTVIDCRDLGLSTLDPRVAEFFCSAIMIPVERHVVSRMAEARNHPMGKRRYMWKVPY